jgi:hypothetical protein
VKLGIRRRAEFASGNSCVAIHELVSVSSRHPALLFAVRGDFRPQEINSFVWPCSETDIKRLVVAGDKASELYFDLTRTPPYLYITFSGHYDEAWWTTYG